MPQFSASVHWNFIWNKPSTGCKENDHTVYFHLPTLSGKASLLLTSDGPCLVQKKVQVFITLFWCSWNWFEKCHSSVSRIVSEHTKLIQNKNLLTGVIILMEWEQPNIKHCRITTHTPELMWGNWPVTECFAFWGWVVNKHGREKRKNLRETGRKTQGMRDMQPLQWLISLKRNLPCQGYT